MPLLLFDIDGTLVTCGQQVRPLFAAALEEVFGTSGVLDGYSFSGKTDPQIVLELLTAVGIDRETVLAGLPRARESFARRLERGLARRGMRLLPGVGEILLELAAHPGVTLGLLTGNWEPTGRIKLDCFDLNGFFRFGAFGDDGVERDELPPVALTRAAAHAGRDFAREEVLVIGDSPNDVACAKAHGLKCLAVATGWTPAERLEAAGADWVVPDLSAAGEALASLLA